MTPVRPTKAATHTDNRAPPRTDPTAHQIHQCRSAMLIRHRAAEGSVAGTAKIHADDAPPGVVRRPGRYDFAPLPEAE